MLQSHCSDPCWVGNIPLHMWHTRTYLGACLCLLAASTDQQWNWSDLSCSWGCWEISPLHNVLAWCNVLSLWPPWSFCYTFQHSWLISPNRHQKQHQCKNFQHPHTGPVTGLLSKVINIIFLSIYKSNIGSVPLKLKIAISIKCQKYEVP